MITYLLNECAFFNQERYDSRMCDFIVFTPCELLPCFVVLKPVLVMNQHKIGLITEVGEST